MQEGYSPTWFKLRVVSGEIQHLQRDEHAYGNASWYTPLTRTPDYTCAQARTMELAVSVNTSLGFGLAALMACAAEAGIEVERMEPPFWWAGMQHPKLQIMVHGADVAELEPEIDCPGIELSTVTRVANPNYMFLDLKLEASLAPGSCAIRYQAPSGEVIALPYQFRERHPGSAAREGFSSASVLYLITPDRFANGDLDNDAVPEMLEGLQRDKPRGRHGGDLQGIINHLGYIEDLGFTHIWLNPVLENNQPDHSYHGYSTTDYYKVDPRFGSNELYVELSERAKAMGIGLVMDLIPNHMGSGHWWMDDMPMPDWLNHGRYVQTTHVREPLHDPHAPESERRGFVDGWFVRTMPDLNQNNPLLAEYLIQNAIWWVEYADLAGIRVDTWSYADKHFLSDWTGRVMAEYPNFTIVGEEWIDDASVIAYWQSGKARSDGYVSHLPSLMDFPLTLALRKALLADETWNSGLINVYRSLAKDFVYADPDYLLVFADNHDMRRIYSHLNGDIDLFRLAMVLVLTTRGIPQVFYGTEILMGAPGVSDHGSLRADFPGGWAGDAVNGFTGEGLPEASMEAQQFFKKLLHWRRQSAAVTTGKLTHYAPRDGAYVYFRHTEEERVMVALNKSDAPYSLALARFDEMLSGAPQAVDVLTGTTHSLQGDLEIPARGFLILEF